MKLLSYSARCALVVELTNLLRKRGSWCGETHLQKAIFLIQDLARADFGYRFVIYKHGPYSFELNSELVAMRAAEIVQLNILRDGYGPSIVPTDFGKRIYAVNEENIRDLQPALKFVVDWIGASDVRQLEKLATAYFLTKKHPRDTPIERAKRLTSLKPHVDLSAAEEAVLMVDQKRAIAQAQLARVAA